MSDQSQGPGWWQASDGKWYAPERHPNFVPPAPVVGPPGITPPLPPVTTQTAPVVTRTPSPTATQVPEAMVIGPRQLSAAKVPRRWWALAVPVIAGGLALAIVLPLTVGGAPKTTSTTTHPAGVNTGLTGSYVGNPTGPQPLPLFLTLVQSGSSLSGTLTASIPTASFTSLTNTSTKVTGTVKGSKLTLADRINGQASSVTGSFSPTSLTFDFGQGVSVVFKRGTLAQFDALVVREGKSVLAELAASVADRAAESNLTNATTEAKALYQVSQSYSSTNGPPYGVSTFTMQAPEFAWTTGSCSAATANCVSFQVMDVSADHDAQGVALATYSSKSSTCWYAIDIETTPVVVPNDASALRSSSNSPNARVKAGVFYARSPVGSSPTSCSAPLVLHAHHAAWTDSYSAAGGLS